MVVVLSSGPVSAASCCTKHRIGTDAAAVCPACGEATILGLSVPLAGALGFAAAAVAGGSAYLAARRWRIRRPAVAAM
jgi:hypothetical protein